MAVLKILLLFVTAQLVVLKPTHFKEIKIKRNLEFSLKPIKFKPITFIKEIWTPHAHIVKKHVVERRSPEEGPPEVLPVQHEREEPRLFNVKLEKSVEAIPPVLPPTPHIPLPHVPVPPPGENEVPPHKGLITVSHDIRPPLIIEEPPKPTPIVRPPLLFTSVVPPISTPLPPAFGASEQISSAPPPVFLPSPAPLGPVIPGLNPTPIASPPVEVVAIGGAGHKPAPGPPPPAEILNVPSTGSLLTDIARVDKINSYLKAVDGLPLIKPPLEENLIPGSSIEAEVPKDTALTGPLVKGSRLALYFGNILLQVMSEVISSARSAISQYSKPAPI